MTPADNAERLAAAELWFEQKKYVASVRFFAAAFQDAPQLADQPDKFYRYQAARAAARVAGGEGDAAQLDDAERSRIRQKAREWLEAELLAAEHLIESSEPRERQRTLLRLLSWVLDPELASIRDRSRLTILSAEEQQACEAFWSKLKQTITKGSQR